MNTATKTIRRGEVIGKKAVQNAVKWSEASPRSMIEAVKAGLPFKDLTALQAGLGISLESLAGRVGISKATLHRRKLSGRFASDESDRILRFVRLMGRAVEALESAENARAWLTSKQLGLGGAVPLDYAETEIGSREVENLLGRIEHGVYS